MKIEIKVIPNAKRNELTKTDDGVYRARLTAPPADGKANAALVEMLAKEFNLPKRDIKILRGQTARNKTVEIDGV